MIMVAAPAAYPQGYAGRLRAGRAEQEAGRAVAVATTANAVTAGRQDSRGAVAVQAVQAARVGAWRDPLCHQRSRNLQSATTQIGRSCNRPPSSLNAKHLFDEGAASMILGHWCHI